MTFPKICIFGLGDHAVRGHLNHLSRLMPGATIGVFDIKFPVAVDLSQLEDLDILPETQLQAFATEEDALAWADAVMICTPDRFHLPQMRAAVEAGKDVFCEKPLAASPDEVAKLKETFDLAKAKGVSITSCHPRRFDPPYVAISCLLPAWVKEFGRPLEVKLDFSYHVPSKEGLHGGSMLQDHANHELDYLHYLLGVVPFRAHRLWDEEDRYALAGVRKDGVTFAFGGTRRLNTSTYPETVWLRFERGEVFVDTKNGRNTYALNHETRKRSVFKGEFPVTDYNKRFGDMNAHWLAMLAGKAENYLTTEEMLLNTIISVSIRKDGPDMMTYSV